MGRYCTINQYHTISRSIHSCDISSGHEAFKKLLLVVMSILNHTDKSDKALYAVGNVPPDAPNYADCIYKLQALYDNPNVTHEDIKPVIEYVDAYISLKSGIIPKEVT